MFIKYPSDDSLSFFKDEEIPQNSVNRMEVEKERFKNVKSHSYQHRPKCPHCNKIYNIHKPCTCCGFFMGNQKLEKYKLKEGVKYKYKDRCPVCEAPYTPKEPCFYCGYFMGKPIFYPFNKMIPSSLTVGKSEDKMGDILEERDFYHIDDEGIHKACINLEKDEMESEKESFTENVEMKVEALDIPYSDNTMYEIIDEEYCKSKNLIISEEKINDKLSSKRKDKEEDKKKEKHKSREKDKSRDKKKSSKRKKR